MSTRPRCAGGGATPTAPSASLAPIGSLSSSADASVTAAAAQPHFNLEATLRADGFGVVKLRQLKDPTQDIIYMDAWVRDLLPNTSYDLQRAVDSPSGWRLHRHEFLDRHRVCESPA